jgi:hypothetical protein
MSRARHEQQIKLNDSTFGGEFDRALSRILEDNAGLAWFTAKQIADLREEMLSSEWSRHKFRREQRKQALALKIRMRRDV